MDLTKSLALSNKEKLSTYSIIWVKEGGIELEIDGILIALTNQQMTFLHPLKKVKIVKLAGTIRIIQFNTALYDFAQSSHQLSGNGLLFFGAPGIPMIDLRVSDQVSKFELVLTALKEEFEIARVVQE